MSKREMIAVCAIILAAGLYAITGYAFSENEGNGDPAGATRWQGYPRLSPFEAVRWTPQVKVNGNWYELVSVNGVPVEKMRDYCQSTGDSEHFWQKHFGEDLVEILSHVSNAPGSAVDLELKDPATGQSQMLSQVPMNEQNRQAILKSDSDIR